MPGSGLPGIVGASEYMSTSTSCEAGELQFSDLVRHDCIMDNLRAESRDDALSSMAEYLVHRGNCKPSFVRGILDREAVHPSGLPMAGPKIAIPHTDAEHVSESVILFARLAAPVEFRAMGNPDERLQVRMISMFALKEKKRIGDMLETLITAYQQEVTLNAILNAENSNEIFGILKAAVEGKV